MGPTYTKKTVSPGSSSANIIPLRNPIVRLLGYSSLGFHRHTLTRKYLHKYWGHRCKYLSTFGLVLRTWENGALVSMQAAFLACPRSHHGWCVCWLRPGRQKRPDETSQSHRTTIREPFSQSRSPEALNLAVHFTSRDVSFPNTVHMNAGLNVGDRFRGQPPSQTRCSTNLGLLKLKLPAFLL